MMASLPFSRNKQEIAIAMSSTEKTLRDFYDAMYAAYGPQHWWPGESRIEIVVGAILTQNTNWQNVERAIERLRAARCLNWKALHEIATEDLAKLIRPAGYYNVKARRLKHFIDWLWTEHGGDFDRLEQAPTAELRAALLGIHGIGEETADSILLYGLDKKTFVIDAYTARITRRHGLVDGAARYADLQRLFASHLNGDAALYNEYHALIVQVGKNHCKPRARCAGCPLEAFPHDESA